MNDYEYFKLKSQLSILKDVLTEYQGKTIDNIIRNIQSRIDWYEKHCTNLHKV